jgi:hypothetical protein
MEIIDSLSNSSSRAEFNLLFQQIERSFYIQDVNSLTPVPLKSNFHFNGVTCPIYTDKASADEMSFRMFDAYNLEVESKNINAFWDFVGFSARNGSDGLILNEQIPIYFYNRISDLDKSVPTVVGIKLHDSKLSNNLVFFGRNGLMNTKNGMLVEWSDLDRMDKLSVTFGLDYEMVSEHPTRPCIIEQKGVNDLIFTNGATILGKYVADIGAIPIFSTHQYAMNFAKWNGINIDGDEYRLKEINLVKKLEEIFSQHNSFCDIGLNPMFKRYDQGWFFKAGDNWYLETISGAWKICDNEFLKEEKSSFKSIFKESSIDIDLFKNITTQAKYPLKRVLGGNTLGFEDEDADELISSFKDEETELIELLDSTIPSREHFMVDMFDAITGDNHALSNFSDSNDLGYCVFYDIFAFAAYLKANLLPFDERIRLNGATLCHGGGVSGSNDKEKEIVITNSIEKCLNNVLKDVLKDGYKPYHSFIVKQLINKNTVTIQIQSIGYFSDIIFYEFYEDSGFESRIEQNNLSSNAIKKLRTLHKKITEEQILPDSIYIKMKGYLGDAFEKLSPDSQLILSTALSEFEIAGHSNYFDYAGISMKVAKVFEREINLNIFKKWVQKAKASFSKSEIQNMTVDRHIFDSEALLYKVLNKNEKPTIGNTLFLLRNVSNDNKPLSQHFYIMLKREMKWLLSEEFKCLLNDILKKYRNGGVHEHMVTYNTCREAIEITVTGPNPLLKKFISSYSE